MASRSSRQRSDSPVAPEHAAALLEDGARIEGPDAELIAAADQMRGQGLIECGVREYVLCVEPRDADFPPRNRHCQGRVFLEDGQDEDGDEIRCPGCERPVRPFSLGKHRHRLLQVGVCQPGVLAWIRGRLEEVSTAVRDLGDNAFHVGGFGDLGVVVCVADADGRADSRFNTRDFAGTNPTCYITVSPRVSAGRFLKDGWVCRVALCDLLAGKADMRKVLTDLAARPAPSTFGKADIPVYAKGHVLVQPELKPRASRLFVVELCDDHVRIDGEIVINRQAGPRLTLFRILWDQFLEDLSKGLSPARFSALSLKRLLARMAEEEHPYSDEMSLRKVINNLQSDIENAVKRKIGKPICREDIVETCRMTGQADTSGGYRINPLSVAIRPAQAR